VGKMKNIIGSTRTYWTSSLINVFGKENIRVVQIGAWNGHETNQIAEVVSNWGGELIVIDWFKGNVSVTEDNDIKYDEEHIEENKKLFWSNIHPNNRKCIDLRVGNSNELIKDIEDDSIDIFHIDGAHEYSIVKKDIELGYPKLKVNGFMCGDDYSGDYNLNRVFELDNKHLEQDTIDGVGYQHHNGNIYPNIHAGVIKAVYEYFDKGDVMFNLPQAKWLHWKKPNSEVGYNMGAYVNGIILKGELLEEVDLSSVRELPAFGSEFKK
tara:strand:+ start:60 stop:860 length:801 start_codon:yes stop_codon:yes gene_type:complete